MGQPKALLPWQGTTLIGYCLAELRETRIDRVVVVLGPGSESILASLDARRGRATGVQPRSRERSKRVHPHRRGRGRR